MSVFTGIDISVYQGNVNWDALAQSVSFVIYRGGSAQGGLHADAEFLNNHAQARAHNVPRGIYWFGGATDATTEADYFYEQCLTNLEPGEVVILDAEWNLATDPTWCLTFLQHLESKLGFKPMIYMNHALMMSGDWSQVASDNYGLWLADWNGDPNIVVSMHDWVFCAIQQYKDNGNIAGIDPVDVDAFFASTMDVWAKYGKPDVVSVPPVAPTPLATPAPPSTPTPTPVVVNDPLPPAPVSTPTVSTPSSTTSPVPKPVVVITPTETLGERLSHYYKGVVAFLTVVVSLLTTWSVLVPPSAQHWVQLAVGLLGTAGVIAVPNRPRG